jgi:hypothetical protein
MKYLDMPPMNDHCEPYARMMREVSKGRSVALIPVVNQDESRAIFMWAAKPMGELTEENTLVHCTRMVVGARAAAETKTSSPVPRNR